MLWHSNFATVDAVVNFKIASSINQPLTHTSKINHHNKNNNNQTTEQPNNQRSSTKPNQTTPN